MQKLHFEIDGKLHFRRSSRIEAHLGRPFYNTKRTGRAYRKIGTDSEEDNGKPAGKRTDGAKKRKKKREMGGFDQSTRGNDRLTNRESPSKIKSYFILDGLFVSGKFERRGFHGIY